MTFRVLTLTLVALQAFASPLYRRAQEYRTVTTDRYEVVVQKSGWLDVQLPSGASVFKHAHPMIWLDGEDEPKALPMDGRRSLRLEVNNKLGQGQGIVLEKNNCEWQVQTYVGQPFFTVRQVFHNRSRKSVKVKALLPWCVGERHGSCLSLGSGTANSVVLENGRVLHSDGDIPGRRIGDGISLWNMAVYNALAGRSLIAGTLTNQRGYGRLVVERGDDAGQDVYGLFRAACVYDPPIEIPPKSSLESEIVYVAVAENSPFEGLERYAHAMAVVNGVKPQPPLLPHGWDSWSTQYRTDITEDAMLAALDVVDHQLKRYGWTHFGIDDGWQVENGNWEPHPEKFPHGMKWMADQIHARGMTAGLWLNPFTVNLGTPIASSHPEWLAKPNAEGSEMMSEDVRILDVTAPGAYEYVRDLCARISNEWGYDALVEVDFLYHLLVAEKYHNPALTRVEVFNMGMRAVREGFGKDKFIMGLAPLPLMGVVTNGMRIGDDCAPIWRKQPDNWPWGGVEALATAARRYYFAPYMWRSDQDCAFFGHEATRKRWHVENAPPLTMNQSIAWLTGAAMTGGVVKVGDVFQNLNKQELAVLRKLLPVPDRPARPVDLFESEYPRIWHLPLRTKAGEWQIVGLFNWDEKNAQTVGVDFRRLGLSPSAYYSVYDFWHNVYHGTAQGTLNVAVPAGSVRLLGLRKYADRPMFLASDRHFTQGAMELTRLEWNAQAKQLSGRMTGVTDTDYHLRFLVPDPYKAISATTSIGTPDVDLDGNVLTLSFHCPEAKPIDWQVGF